MLVGELLYNNIPNKEGFMLAWTGEQPEVAINLRLARLSRIYCRRDKFI